MIKQNLWSEKWIPCAMLLLLMNFGFSNASELSASEPAVSNSSQQSIKITGKVTDSSGSSLPGVSVVIKGTTNGTNTDATGNYSLSNIPANSTLVFSFVGMTTQELVIGSKTTVNVVLQEETVNIEQVVVVGYGTVKKSDLTGSIATVSTKEMKNTSVLSADQAIQGRTTGVLVVNNSGAPGSPVSIKIRGIGSFGNTDPLYVVDGMPVKDASFGKDDNPSGINYLNPNDIESIQVLKDASSAAIYGTRGANGVILITTKRGKSGQMKVDFENYLGVQSLNKNVDVLNAQQYAKLYNEIKTDNLFDPATIPGLQTTKWIDEITRQAIVLNNQLSISGGSNKTNYFLSANNYNQQGVVNGSQFNRQSLRLNVDSEVKTWLKTGVSLTIMQSFRERQTEGGGGVISQALKSDPTVAVYDSTGNWSYMPRTGGNPVGQVQRNNYSYTTTRMQGTVFMEIEFLKNLKYKLNVGLDRSFGKKSDFQPAFFIAGPESQAQNVLYEGQDAWNNWLIENTLSYSITKNKHKLDVLAGYTTQHERKESYTMGAYLPSNDPDMRYFSNVKVLTDVIQLNGDALEWALISQIARLNYAYGDKYLFTASVRRDGSSRFGSNNKYGVFPSWSAAWKISNEDFFRNADLLSGINQLKLRFGMGKVGNQNIDPYAYLGSVSNRPDLGRNALQTYFGLPKVVVPVYVDKTLSNADVGWETSVSSNLGLDVSFWKDKLSMTLDLYNKTTNDLLMTKPLPIYFSQIDALFGYARVNLGSLSNKGFEYSVSYKKYEGNFNYELSANFSKNYNKMLSLDGGQPPLSGTTVVKENVALGTYYGYKTEGIFQNTDEIKNHAAQAARTAPGDIKFVDLNKDGKIDASDQTYIGNAFPGFIYGFTFNFSYKGFDLNVFTQGVQGNQIYNQMRQTGLYNLTLNSNVSPDLLNYWGRKLPDGTTVTNTNIPRLGKDWNNNMRFSDYYLEDGSYFRIKTITLGYTLKKAWVERIRLSNLRIYVTAQNPLTFTKYSGYDPEIGQSNGWNASPLDFGVDAGAYPQARMVMGGLSISF
jgi:TonB-dependent starch-binding outer membrane protein SusC